MRNKVSTLPDGKGLFRDVEIWLQQSNVIDDSHTSRTNSVTVFILSEENGEKRHKDGDGEVEEKIPYPKSIFFILSMEACERFSYYGMRSTGSAFLWVILRERVKISFLFSCVVTLPEVPLHGQWDEK